MRSGADSTSSTSMSGESGVKVGVHNSIFLTLGESGIIPLMIMLFIFIRLLTRGVSFLKTDITVGLLSIAALTTGIIRSNQVTKRLTTATIFAQNKMEDIKRLGYSNARTETRVFLLSPYDKYETEVTVVNNSPANNMKTVTVEVYWKLIKTVSLKTILAK